MIWEVENAVPIKLIERLEHNHLSAYQVYGDEIIGCSQDSPIVCFNNLLYTLKNVFKYIL